MLFSLCGDHNKASSRVRGFWISEDLEKLGIHCTLRWDNSKLGLLRLAMEIRKHDAIIFQKTYSRYHRWLMSFANILGKQTYLDLDDAPSRINSLVTLNNVEAMMCMATGVFVGSYSLYDYVRKHQSRTYLIPSGIKLENYNYSPKVEKSLDATVCLGWIGNGSHYKKDLLDILVEPLKNLAKNYSIRFKLIGACGEEELHTAFKSIEGLDTEIIDSIDWSDPACVSKELKSIDVGLYPLLSNDFNQYKCGFKALEYMATGIPVVASDITGMSDIVNNGEDGVLVKTSGDWIQALENLICDDHLRQKMGIAGRGKIEEHYSTVKCAENLYSFISNDAL